LGFVLAAACVLVEHAVAQNAKQLLGKARSGPLGIVVGAPDQGFGVILGNISEGSWHPEPQFPYACSC